jgi:rRNA maturation endonuclease Nob1
MKLICHHCSKSFEGNDEKFCHDSCRDAYIIKIDERVKRAVENDPNHTQKLSRDF